MNCILTERLLTIVQNRLNSRAWRQNAIYQTRCQALGISKVTLMHKIKQISAKLLRKKQR